MTRARRNVVIVVFLAVVVLIVSVGFYATTHRSEQLQTSGTYGGPPIPRSGAYVGAWVRPDPADQAGRISAVHDFQKSIAAPLSIVHTYLRWGVSVGSESDLHFARNGKYLLISWATPDTRELLSGQDDSIIERTAREIAALPTKVFLEIRWEMNRPNLADVVHSPPDYIAAWDHIREVFNRLHVTNVAWTWCPTALGFDNGTASAYYPGDAEVDWVCADIYPTVPHEYPSFASLAQQFLAWAKSHDKPIIVGEFGVNADYGSTRAAWIQQAAAFIRSHPQIKAVVYFDQSVPTEPSAKQWSLGGDPDALAAFGALARELTPRKGG